jgi:hypothetical protein
MQTLERHKFLVTGVLMICKDCFVHYLIGYIKGILKTKVRCLCKVAIIFAQFSVKL